MNALEYAKQICYSSEAVLLFSYEMAKKYAKSKGVYVECGTAAGAQIIAMAHGAPRKTIFAFDSFDGIPLPSNRDDQMPGIRTLSREEQNALPEPGKQKLETTGATSVSQDNFWLNIGVSGVYKDNIIAVEGWFENTTNGFNEPIAILRLDGDLYNSTYVCLKNLYPKVIEGGLVIIDDIQLSGCRAALMDYFKEEGITKELHNISNISYFIK